VNLLQIQLQEELKDMVLALAHNTIRTYKSLYRIIKEYALEKSQELFLAGIDKKMAVSFTQFLKIEKQ
jgi:hypothetical protein